MANRSDRRIEAAELLRQIVEQAVDDGAEMIDFERVPKGLEITAFLGANGVGNVLNDRELVSALFRWVEKDAKLGLGDRGTIEVVVHGGKRTVGFQWYDSFGISRQNHRGVWRQDGTHRRRADESRNSQEAATQTQASARTQTRQVRNA